MNKVFGYTRVSTIKQGNGVSLQEQREAILRYAQKNDLEIIEWFEELETAAKQGRPLFTKMLKLIRQNKAEGAIIHKIDRSARNLKDWASLGDLIDEGYKIYFAHESLDLNQRGGRLAADIQAVIASDYIRNLREEAIKGLYGRLKQGVYPFKAPIGYLDTGSGIPKAVDEIKAPMVLEAFNLYATEKFTIQSLCDLFNSKGYKNSKGDKFYKNSIAKILNNPFYTGVMKIKGQTFVGNHTPIISPNLFNMVQNILKGKTNRKVHKHVCLFNKIIKCNFCNHFLIAERQKQFIYYRCHTKNCKSKTFREDQIERSLVKIIQHVHLSEFASDEFNSLLSEFKENSYIDSKNIINSIMLQSGQLKIKLERLTDALIDGSIDKEIFELRKEKLMIDLKFLDHRKTQIQSESSKITIKVRKMFELLKSLKNSYLNGNLEEKRKLLKIISSNFFVEGRKLMITMRNPFQDIANLHNVSFGGTNQANPRDSIPEIDNLENTIVDRVQIREEMKELLDKLISFFKDNPDSEIINLIED